LLPNWLRSQSFDFGPIANFLYNTENKVDGVKIISMQPIVLATS
jgi:hypothetical protein